MLVFQPNVVPIAYTQVDIENLDQWVTSEDLKSVIADETTPLSRIYASAGDGEDLIELAGRHCYRAWRRGRSKEDYIPNLNQEGHGSVLEHATITFAISGVSRTLTHELIRHRVGAAVSQESQRYVDAKDVRWVVPPLLAFIAGGDEKHPALVDFEAACNNSRFEYQVLQANLMARLEARAGVKDRTLMRKRVNEAARSLLPGCAETRLVWTVNYRTIQHIAGMRGSPHADLEIRRLACTILKHAQDEAPNTFTDFEIHDGDYGVPYARQL